MRSSPLVAAPRLAAAYNLLAVLAADALNIVDREVDGVVSATDQCLSDLKRLCADLERQVETNQQLVEELLASGLEGCEAISHDKRVLYATHAL